MRRLRRCPATYTPDDRIAFAAGNRLLAGRRTLLRADGELTFADFTGANSTVVVVDGNRIEARDGSLLRYALELPPRLVGVTPIVSPGGCSAAFRPLERPGRIVVVDLGCAPGRSPRTFFGRDAAWSPDGRWLAVAERKAIALHRLVGRARTIRWPAAAVHLAWRAG